MRRFSAIIDTNILHAGLYSSSGASFQILRLIEAGHLTPLLSTTLLFEYEEILRRHQQRLKLSNRAIDDVLDGFCYCGTYQKVHFLWRPQLSDPKDDHILELAVAAGGAPVITHNMKDFKRAANFGIRIARPAEILGELK